MLAMVTALLAAVPAHGHASLTSSDPAAEAVLSASPPSISLTFSEPVEPLSLQLIDAGGQAQAAGAIARDGGTLRFAPPAPLGPGAHVVSYRVMSADGHPVGGSLTFWIGAAAQGLPPITVPDDPVRRTAIWATAIVVQLMLLGSTGAAFFLAWIAIGPASTGVIAICAAAAVAGLGADALSIGLQGLDVLDKAFARLGDPEVWSAGASGSFGLAASIVAAALGASLLSLLGRGAPARLLSLTAVIGAGAAFAVSGHAATAAPRALATGAMLVHGVSLALWIGALLPLAAAIGRSGAGAASLLRFSRAIPVVIAALLISGIALAGIQLGRVDALWTSPYGRILIAKITLVVALLALALHNRLRLTPRVAAGSALAATAMRRMIAAELVLVAAILGIVALWRFTPPPVAPALDRVVVHLAAERIMADVTVEPDRAGPLDIRIKLQTPGEAPLQPQAVTVTLSNRNAGIEPASVQAERQPDGTWRLRMSAPVPGRWTLSLAVLISDFNKVSIETPIPIR